MSIKVSTAICFHPSLFFIQRKPKSSIILAGTLDCVNQKSQVLVGTIFNRMLHQGLLDTSALVFCDSHISYNTLHSLPQYPYSDFPQGHVYIHTHTHTHTHTLMLTHTCHMCTWRREWQPIPVFLPRESHEQRSLVGCCPWGRTESDTTEAT